MTRAAEGTPGAVTGAHQIPASYPAALQTARELYALALQATQEMISRACNAGLRRCAHGKTTQTRCRSRTKHRRQVATT